MGIAMGIFSWLATIRFPEEPRWVRRWVFPTRESEDKLTPREIEKDEELEELKEAAAEETDAMREEDRRYFRQDGPGHDRDAL
ncbi:MAG TPA: hypothetical protein VEC76_17620 [Streptosporangiaceae bacterium]|nr:hypothetical protein [Streptosporangiaceae bacterium]